MTRLFIGTFVSEADQQRLAQLPEVNADLEETWRRKIRWVKPEKMHMTWVFLGTMSGDLVQPITDMFSNLVTSELNRNTDKAPMQITFDHAEIWPDPRKPRQIVLRPTSVDERVLKLAKVLRTGLLEFYFEQSQKEEERTFKPHLTLLRIERRQEKAAFTRTTASRVKLQDVQAVDKALPIVLGLDKIQLIESHLGKNSSYSILHEVSLVPSL